MTCGVKGRGGLHTPSYSKGLSPGPCPGWKWLSHSVLTRGHDPSRTVYVPCTASPGTSLLAASANVPA